MSMWCKADRSVFLTSIAVLAVGVAGTWLVLSQGRRPPSDDLVEVLVVREDLPLLTQLDESAIRSHIGRGTVRRDRLPAGAVLDEKVVLGKRTLRTLRAGEYLLDADVGHPSVSFLPDGCHMFVVRLDPDDRSTDTFRPGGRVNLFVGVRVGEGRVTSVPVAKGLLVLAVNAADRDFTVAVTLAQVEDIRAAEYRGDFRAVRSGGAK